ncbi:hypothetical protein V6N12_046299 [Hibiscus sabdariffa]|uniref:Uncharacterized protein n=1 Tax=Hibiscus sabdariffa TaxID=183260 RepID=A0ABR1ZDS1_9ROSI
MRRIFPKSHHFLFPIRFTYPDAERQSLQHSICTLKAKVIPGITAHPNSNTLKHGGGSRTNKDEFRHFALALL